MSELDLIPAEYRLWIWQLTWIKRWVWMLVAIFGVTLAVHFGLRYSTRAIEEQVRSLEQRKKISLQQRQEIEQLRAEREVIERRLVALEAVRNSDPTLDVLRGVDRAIGGKSVWFQQWEFDGGSVASTQSQPAQLRFRGQAVDHGALSRFVAALLSEPLIEDAQITHSAVRRYVSSSVVDFEMTATLRTQPEARR